MRYPRPWNVLFITVSFRKALSQPAKPCFIFKTPFCTLAKPSFNFKTPFRNPRQPFSKPFGPIAALHRPFSNSIGGIESLFYPFGRDSVIYGTGGKSFLDTTSNVNLSTEQPKSAICFAAPGLTIPFILPHRKNMLPFFMS